jgi:hypothetical protein
LTQAQKDIAAAAQATNRVLSLDELANNILFIDLQAPSPAG